MEEPENYPEAFSNAAYAFKPPNEIPDNVQALLDICDSPPTKDQLWVYVKALKNFISQKGKTPTSGVIPDFHSDTDSYVKIKNLYNEQASKDYDEMMKLVKELTPEGETIDEEDLKLFCKNWQHAEAIQIRPIQDQINTEWLYEEDPAGFGWYFVFKAADKFFQKHARHPGPEDKEALSQLVYQVVTESGVEDYTVEDKFVSEMYIWFTLGAEQKVDR